jgi:hypothetical protein
VSNKDPLIEAVTPDTNWYVVLRPFGGQATEFVRGEVVDTNGWLHTNTLVNRRYIAPLPYGAKVPEETEQPDGTIRRMIVLDGEALESKPARKKPVLTADSVRK